MTEDSAGCPSDWIEKMHKYLVKKYKGFREYYKSNGWFEKEEQEKLVAVLKVQSSNISWYKLDGRLYLQIQYL